MTPVFPYSLASSGTFPRYRKSLRSKDVSAPSLSPYNTGLLSTCNWPDLPTRLTTTLWYLFLVSCSLLRIKARPLPKSYLNYKVDSLKLMIAITP